MTSSSNSAELLPSEEYPGDGETALGIVEEARRAVGLDRDWRVQAELEAATLEIERLRNQLAIAEKLATLGRMTAGIAHEINSPLGGILNSISAARSFVEEYQSSIDDPEISPADHRAIAEDLLSALTNAEAAGLKVAQIVRSVKDQTRAGEGDHGNFDPAAEVDATVGLLQHELNRRRVGVFTEMEKGHRLSVDQGKFSVVVRNLVANAVDAYEGDPGHVWIRLRVEGERLLLSVSDEGGGIPDAIRERIFEYLFTTKEVGRGTGLGLAMVQEIVTTSFGGEITLETEAGAGTTFTISIPLRPTPQNHGS